MNQDRINKIYSDYRMVWGVLAAAIICIFLSYTMIIGSQKQEMSRLQETYMSLRQQNRQVPGADMSANRFDSVRQNWRAFVGQLPPMARISDKAKELRDILNRYGTRSGQISFVPTKNETLGLWRYSTSVSLTNNYEDLKRTLAEIQNSYSLFCIEKLSLKRRKVVGEVVLGMDIATYCR